MNIVTTHRLTRQQKERIFRLWNAEYPDNLSFQTLAELEHYLQSLPGITYFFLLNEGKAMEGWAMTFMRDHETWFAITIDQKVQGKGKGSALLNKLKEVAGSIHGWVIDHNNDIKLNGEPYLSPLAFYQKNGFVVCNDSRLELPFLSAVKISWTNPKIPTTPYRNTGF
jgi:GNAT superfamily N-acetyltransferase